MRADCQNGRQWRRPAGQQDDFYKRVPGALHHVRFLASSLYILKMSLLSEELPREMLTPRMLQGVHCMAQYIALFNGQWFLRARIAVAASESRAVETYNTL